MKLFDNCSLHFLMKSSDLTKWLPRSDILNLYSRKYSQATAYWPQRIIKRFLLVLSESKSICNIGLRE